MENRYKSTEYKMHRRIFWCHPKLRDYRESFFRMMSRLYSIQFFLQRPSDLDWDFECIYSTKKGHAISTMRLIPFKDLEILYRGIKCADVYISSFLWSTYSIAGLVIAKFLGKKVIVWEEISLISTDLGSKLRYLFARLLFRYIDAFFVLGEIHKTVLIQLGAIPEKIFVANEYPGQIYHTVAPKRINLALNEDAFVVLFLGRLVEIKGIEYLIKAFGSLEKAYENVALLIVGDGPLRPGLEKLAATLGIRNIHFAGRITDIHQKAFLFQHCNIVVVPSITIGDQREGGPLVVLEALSAGKPVIGTTALGGTEVFIQNGVNGFVIPEKDTKALFEKMNEFIKSNDISEAQVLDSFGRIPGYEYQAEKLQEAINYVMNPENNVLHVAH